MATKQKYLIISLLVALLVISSYLLVSTNYVQSHLDAYATSLAKETLGSQPVSAELETQVKAIAAQMGVTEPIIVCKMNQAALAAWGYCNAVTYFPQFLNIIPISNKPFLFISESFFQDLSPEEQRFLIGHEMVHIKEHHTQYFNLFTWLFILVLGFLSWCLYGFLNRWLQYKLSGAGYTVARVLIAYGLLLFTCGVPNLTGLAYRRYIETEADHQSMIKLNTYDGGIKLIDRWEKEYQLPMVNLYYGLLADHPSSLERKLYCIHLQNLTKGKSL